MAGNRTVRISILGEARGAQQAFAATEKSSTNLLANLGNLGSAFSSVTRIASGFVVAQGVMRAVDAGVSLVKDSFIGMNNLLEQSSIAFTTMLGSAEASEKFLSDLADFAAATPFDFPGLLTASQRMMAYGFSAREVLPLLEDIGNASAALGAGAQGVDRMTLALGQMAAKGKVQTQELLQLTELGIPAFQLLADAVGVSVGEIQDMVSAGEISSDVFLRIFHEWSQANFGAMMEKQSKTFSGAWSNITDVLQMSVARGLSPFFNALRDGSIRLAEFLETDRFNRWATTLQQVSQAAVDAILRIPQTGRAIHAWVAGILAGGVTLSEFLTTLPDWFTTTLDRISELMGVGGHNAIVAYAQGIVNGASTYVTQAINFVADLIASYLVGQSPPPAGPLSQIDQAGVNLMTTYTAGMIRGSTGAQVAAQAVAVHMDNLAKRMELDAGRAGLQAATGNLEAMEAVARDVESRIADIDSRLREIDSELLEIARHTDQINDRYDDQLAPLDEQLRLLEKQRDLSAEKLQLETDLARARIQQAQLEALGDPERRAEIAGELALVDLQQDRLANEQAIADVRAQLEGGGKELTKAEREALELRERDLELQLKETQQRLRDGKELTKLERERLQLKLDQINANLRENRAQQNAQPEELTDAERQRLELQLQELELRGELLAMIDAEATAQAEADEALLDAREREKELIEEIADLERDIAKIPILEQIEEIEAARRRELEPLEEQKAALEAQRGDLDYMRKQWGFIEADVRLALTPLQEATRLQEQMARDAERAAKAAGGGKDGSGLVLPEMPTWSELFPEPETLEIPVVAVPGAEGDTLTLDMLKPGPESLGKKFGRLFADGAIERLGEIFQENMGRMIGSSIGAAAGGGIGSLVGLGSAGAVIGGLLGGFIGEGMQDALAERGVDLEGVSEGLQSQFDQRVRPVLTTLQTLVDTVVLPALGRFSEWFSGDGQETIQRFVDWFTTDGMRMFERITEWLSTDGMAAFDTITGFFGEILELAQSGDWEGLGSKLGGLLRGVLATMITTFADMGGEIATAVGQLIQKVDWLGLGKKVAPAALLFVVGFADALLDPAVWWQVLQEAWLEIGLLIIGLVAAPTRLLRPLVIALRRIPLAGRLLAWLVEAIRSVGRGALRPIGQVISQIWEAFVRGFRSAFDGGGAPLLGGLRRFFGDAVAFVQIYIEHFWSLGLRLVERLGRAIAEHGPKQAVNAFRAIFNFVDRLFTEWLPRVTAFLVRGVRNWGGALIRWIPDAGRSLLGALDSLGRRMFGWITDTALPGIRTRVVAWGRAFIDWIGPRISDLISEAGKLSARLLSWITDTALPSIRTRLTEWGRAFIGWIGDEVTGNGKILPALAGIAAAITAWIVDDALPGIRDKLTEWGGAFLGWIGDEVTGQGQILTSLWSIATALGAWIVEDALPWIVERLVSWGGAFLGWIAKDVLPFIVTKLGEISTALLNWITNTALPWIVDRLKGWGSAFLSWVGEQVLGEDGLVAKLGGVARAILDWIGGKKTGATLLIKSKLIEFANAFLDWIKEGVLGEDGIVSKLGGVLSAITGWVTDNLQSVKDSVFGVGKALLEGIEQGIRDSFDATLGKALDWASDKVPDVLKRLWGISSPARITMPMGGDLLRGVAVGAERVVPEIVERIGRVSAMVRDSLRPEGGLSLAGTGLGSFNTDVSGAGLGREPIIIEFHHTTMLGDDLFDHRIERVSAAGANRRAQTTW